MYTIKMTGQFKKDLKRIQNRPEKIKILIIISDGVITIATLVMSCEALFEALLGGYDDIVIYI